MLKFKNVNVNPKGRKTGDCSTRAIANVLGISYEQALREQCEMAVKYCYGLTTKETIDKVMQKYGWVKIKQPKHIDGTKYLVGNINALTDKDCLILMANHFTAVKNGCIEDIWDCRYKTIGNYWIKEDNV